VSRPAFEHPEERTEHRPGGAHFFPGSVLVRRCPVVVAEQFVRAVYNVGFHEY